MQYLVLSAFYHFYIPTATRNNHYDMMKLLLCFNANVNQKLAHSRTALHEAARLGLMDFTELLLKSGADADARSTYGLTPLALAAQAGHLEIVKELVSRGQEVYRSCCIIIIYRFNLIMVLYCVNR